MIDLMQKTPFKKQERLLAGNRTRHKTRCIASTHSAVLSRGRVLQSQLGGTPVLSYLIGYHSTFLSRRYPHLDWSTSPGRTRVSPHLGLGYPLAGTRLPHGKDLVPKTLERTWEWVTPTCGGQTENITFPILRMRAAIILNFNYMIQYFSNFVFTIS